MNLEVAVAMEDAESRETNEVNFCRSFCSFTVHRLRRTPRRDGLTKSGRRQSEREIESEGLIIEEWLLIPIYMESHNARRGGKGLRNL